MVLPKARQKEIEWRSNISNGLVRTLIEESFQEDSETITAALRTIKNRAALLKAYTEFVALVYPEVVGHEFEEVDGSPLDKRLYAFVYQRVYSSKGRTKKDAPMSVNSLNSLRWTLLWLVIDNNRTLDKAAWTKLTYQWVKGLHRRFRLPSLPMERLVFGYDEVRLLIEELLSCPILWDNSIQHAISCLLQYLIGCRPSSIFVTDPYKTFLQNKHFLLRRTMLKGIFDLDTSLVVFKGHSESQIRIVYSIRAPGRIRNLFLYIGGLIVVLGIRRGDFRDYNTMEELLAGDDDKLHWKDPDLPFFRAAGPRGLKMTANPMTSEGARAFLHKTAAAVGINGGGEGQARASPYSFRANFATVVKKAAGNDTAAKSMGHRAGSHTVAEIYDVGLSRYDFFGLGSGEEMRDNVQQGRSVAVYAAPVKVKPLEVAELVEQDPSIALLIKEAQNLKECIRTGGEGWKELLYDQSQLEPHDTLDKVYAYTVRRLNRVVQQVQDAHRERIQQDAYVSRKDTITTTEREQRIAELAQPLDLVQVLKNARERCLQGGGLLPPDPADNEEDRRVDIPMELPVVIDEPDEMQKIDEKDEDDEQDYLHEVETMLIMLASMRDATKQQHFCDECRDDITCDPADAEKSFLSAAHLTRHRASYHSPKNRSKRFLKASKMEQIVAGSRNCFRCVWPAQCEPDLEDDEEADDNLDKTAGELPVKLSRRSYRYKVQMLQHIVNAHTNGEVPQELLDCFREEIASNSSKAGRSGRQDVDSGEGDEGDEEMTEPRVLEDGQDSEDEDDLCCSECLCDPSFTPETRPGSFASAASLRKHRQAKLHSPQARAIRMLKKDGGKSISLSTSTCPYCKQFVGSLLQVCEHIVSMAHLSLPLPVLGVYEALLQSLDEHRPQHASPEDQRAALDAVFANWGAFPSTTPGEDFFRPWYKSGEALWWEVAPQDLDIQSMAAQWGEMDVDSEQQAWGVHDDWGSFVPL